MSDYLELRGLRAAERFVERQQAAGNDIRWDGFDKIVCFRKSDQGITSPQGAFRNGSWGFDNVAVVDNNGVFRIDYRNVKRTKRSRN